MTRIEFLQQLRQALENDLSGSVVQENVDYYNQYISDEVRKGKSEEEVLRMLGDPWILARTVIAVSYTHLFSRFHEHYIFYKLHRRSLHLIRLVRICHFYADWIFHFYHSFF